MDVRTGRVTGRSVSTNRDGADSVRLLQVMVTSRYDNQTVQLVSQTGEESSPPDGSCVVLIPAGNGCKLAVGTLDRVVPDLEPGGKRIYSTDATGKVVTGEVRLDPAGDVSIQADGSIVVANENSSVELASDGKITIEGVGCSIELATDGTITLTSGTKFQINGDVEVSGKITASGDIKAGTISLKTHKHNEHDGHLTSTPI